jgi:hypothetical protein
MKQENLLISGNTNDLLGWDVQEIFSESKTDARIALTEYQMDNTIGPYCDGLTYSQIEQLNHSLNY